MEIKQKMKVKVKAKITERDKNGKVLRVRKMPDHVTDNPKVIKALKRRGLRAKNFDKPDKPGKPDNPGGGNGNGPNK